MERIDKPDPDERPDAQPVGSLFGELIEDVEGFVRAELKLQRAKLVARLVESRTAVAMLIVAAILGLATATTLLVGIVMALAPFVGPLGAAAIVAVVGVGVAVLLVSIALRKLDKATRIGEAP